jgi:transcriptional regulator of acetoin/glycerol metabolism
VLTLNDLTPELRGEPPPDGDRSAARPVGERERILRALRKAGGRKAVAAQMLGVSRSTLWRKLREYRLS